MRGQIIAEDRFLHQGIDHHLFVTGIDNAEHEYRFEVKRIAPGSDQSETIYEKTEDLSARLAQNPDRKIGDLLCVEMSVIKKEIFEEEDIHANDP